MLSTRAKRGTEKPAGTGKLFGLQRLDEGDEIVDMLLTRRIVKRV
jgi:hypothetical protein